MFKTLAAVLAAAFLLVSAGFTFGPKSDVMQTRWEGRVDSDFAAKVRGDLQQALNSGAKKIQVVLVSGGGSAVLIFDILRDVKAAQAQGLIVEIHASALTASAATILLGAGTKGYRYVHLNTVALVHPPQVGGGFMSAPTCMGRKEAGENKDKVEGQIVNTLIDMMVREYALASGKSVNEVERWMVCGDEQIGDGQLLIKLGLADKLE